MSCSITDTVAGFVKVFETLRSLDEIKQGYKTLIRTDIPAELVKELNLFDVVRKVPTWPPFEKLKDKLLAKIEQLERVNEMKAEENVEPVTEKSSRFEKKQRPEEKKDEKKPKKRSAEGPGSMEPAAKKPLPIISTSERPDNWIPKKRRAPQARQSQKTTEAAKKPPPPPIISTPSIQGFRIPKRKIEPAGSVEKPAEVVKDALKPVSTAPVKPAAPIVGSSLSQGFRIPKREIVPAGSVEKPHGPAKEPTIAVKSIPVPLTSLNVEKPTWLSDDILAKYEFNH